ncbi:BQ2448_3165 [Microbotryum intermedium]|uniref:BQ2448_3165 protein n=1 Tax=Microbotryum intermedium TaxID=269621 RepID=A0A238FEE9_9BASI|nr:BQ2448_3165 [Microbotryum intermedium]
MVMLPPPPPPSFPTRFPATDDDLGTAIVASTRAGPTIVPIAWPTETTASIPSKSLTSSHALRDCDSVIAWKLKTDREQYLEALESKLTKLAQPAKLGTSKTDSGYGGSHTSPQVGLDRLLLMHDDLLDDININQPALVMALEQPEGASDEEGDVGEDDEDEQTTEGRSLLSRAAKPGVIDGLRRAEPSPGQTREEETPSASPRKSDNIFVIPPTPSHEDMDAGAQARHREDSSEAVTDDPDEEDEEDMPPLEFNRRPSSFGNDPNSMNCPSENSPEQPRRISFSSSVRISGGIRSKGRSSRQRQRAAIPNDLFSPAPSGSSAMTADNVARMGYMAHPLPRNASLTQSRSSSRTNSPSRVATPAGISILRTVSSSSSLGIHNSYREAAILNGGASSIYSSSVPSRSSSPCSSIYAPLKRPSETCPNPMSVKPPAKRVRSPRRPSASGISFREFLRLNGLSRSGDIEGAGADDEESMAERGYRELVEEQRKRKERLDKRKKQYAGRASSLSNWELVDDPAASRGFWDRVWGMLGNGNGRSGVGRASSGALLGAAPTSPEYGTNGTSPLATDGLRRVKRKRSSLSIFSSVAGDQGSSDEGDGEDPRTHSNRRPNRTRSTSGPNVNDTKERIKSEVEVRFGSAPGRWFSSGWILWKLRAIGGTCLGVRRTFRLKRRSLGSSSAIDTSDEESDSAMARDDPSRACQRV